MMNVPDKLLAYALTLVSAFMAVLDDYNQLVRQNNSLWSQKIKLPQHNFLKIEGGGEKKRQ